jgi:hypothetical protein
MSGFVRRGLSAEPLYGLPVSAGATEDTEHTEEEGRKKNPERCLTAKGRDRQGIGQKMISKSAK